MFNTNVVSKWSSQRLWEQVVCFCRLLSFCHLLFDTKNWTDNKTANYGRYRQNVSISIWRWRSIDLQDIILKFWEYSKLWINKQPWTILSSIHYYLWWPVMTIILSISHLFKHPGKHHTTSRVTHAHATHTHHYSCQYILLKLMLWWWFGCLWWLMLLWLNWIMMITTKRR